MDGWAIHLLRKPKYQLVKFVGFENYIPTEGVNPRAWICPFLFFTSIYYCGKISGGFSCRDRKSKEKKNMKKQITIGAGDAATTAKEFIDVWKRAERGETVQEKHRLHFENLEVLLKTLTPGRWALLKRLHANGPMSIRGLANDLGRDYKNVYTDVR
jgi:hypothetical protein